MRFGDNDYKLVFLDTNAIREIICNNNNCGLNFAERFFQNNNTYAPVFSIYNVFELKPYEDLFEKFIDFFSIVPCIIMYPYKIFMEAEYKAFLNNQELELNSNLINVFSSQGKSESHNFRPSALRLIT